MSALLGGLLAEYLPQIVAAVGGLAVIVGAFFKGRSSGRNQILNEQRKADIKAYKTREEVDEKSDSDPDAAVRDRLRGDARR